MDKLRASRRLIEAARPVNVGVRFRAALERKNLAQADIARMFDLNSSQVSQWGKGRSRPSLDALLLILPHLEVTLQYILIGDVTGLDYETQAALAEHEAAVRRADAQRVSDEGGLVNHRK